MSKYWLIALTIVATIGLLFGCATSTSPTYSQPDVDSKLSYCAELLKEIDALKGKPQRRKAASDRYKLECGES